MIAVKEEHQHILYAQEVTPLLKEKVKIFLQVEIATTTFPHALWWSLQKKKHVVRWYNFQNLSHILCFIVWSNQLWKELFTWTLKPQHIALSCNIFALPTNQNTEILFGWEQIYAAKYKFQMVFMAKAQYLEPILFPEGI